MTLPPFTGAHASTAASMALLQQLQGRSPYADASQNAARPAAAAAAVQHLQPGQYSAASSMMQQLPRGGYPLGYLPPGDCLHTLVLVCASVTDCRKMSAS